VALHFESRIEPYSLSGSATRLERAIDNLLDNAVKWSPPGGTIEVVLDGGTLTVRDHGTGVDDADLPHVFDRSYRSASARALPGSGLGLAIVRQTVEDHDGTASSTSRRPTRPSTSRSRSFRSARSSVPTDGC
jgi:two-component system, OmpR family, sensor histidine kinase MprB